MLFMQDAKHGKHGVPCSFKLPPPPYQFLMSTLFSQGRLARAGDSPYMNADVDDFNPRDSDSDIPLMRADHHWAEHAANAVADPILYTPKPRVNSNAPLSFTMSKLPRDEEEGAG